MSKTTCPKAERDIQILPTLSYPKSNIKGQIRHWPKINNLSCTLSLLKEMKTRTSKPTSIRTASINDLLDRKDKSKTKWPDKAPNVWYHWRNIPPQTNSLRKSEKARRKHENLQKMPTTPTMDTLKTSKTTQIFSCHLKTWTFIKTTPESTRLRTECIIQFFIDFN